MWCRLKETPSPRAAVRLRSSHVLFLLGVAPAALGKDAPEAEADLQAGFAHVDQESDAAGVRSVIRDLGVGGFDAVWRLGDGTATWATRLGARGAATAGGQERQGALSGGAAVRLVDPSLTQELSVVGDIGYDASGQLLQPLLEQRALAGLGKEQRARVKGASAGYAGFWELDPLHSVALTMFAAGQNRSFIVRNQIGALKLTTRAGPSTTWDIGVSGFRQSVDQGSASGSFGPAGAVSHQVSPLTAVDVRAGYKWARTLGRSEEPARTYDAGASLRYDDERSALTTAFDRVVSGAITSANVDVTETAAAELSRWVTRRARLTLRVREAKEQRLTGTDEGARATSRTAEIVQSYGFGHPLPWKAARFGQALEASAGRERLQDGVRGGGSRLVVKLSYLVDAF